MNAIHKKNVLVLASTFPRWVHDTTPPFVLELEKRLVDSADIFVLAPHYKGAKDTEVMENVRVHRFHYFWPASLQKLCYNGGILPNIKQNKWLLFQGFTLIFFELIAAITLIKKEKIQIIHAHWIIPQGIVAFIIKKLYGIPYILTTHGGDIYGLQDTLMVKLKKIVVDNAVVITVVSNAIKQVIEKNDKVEVPIKVIPMGVDSELFHPDKYDAVIKKKYKIDGPFLLFVGRLAEKKGVMYLIDAMKKIVLEVPKVKLLIIGEGTLHDILLQRVKKLQLQDNVIFVGPIRNEDLPSFYATADMFIGPSIQTKEGDTEGLGLTFVEASFSGCVPIGTDVGGIADVVQNNKTGILVHEKDPEDLAKAILMLLKNPELRKRLRQQCRKLTVPLFSWEIIQKQYALVYETI